MVILVSSCDVITPIFDEFFTITRKIKIGEFFYYFSHSIQSIAHLSWKWDQNWGGWGLLVVPWDKAFKFEHFRKKKIEKKMLLKNIIKKKKIFFFLNTKKNRLKRMIKKYSGSVPTKDMQIRPPSVLIPLSWKMRNVLNRMKKQLSDFCDFYFSSYRENSSKIDKF